jgi:hypothetical protein
MRERRGREKIGRGRRREYCGYARGPTLALALAMAMAMAVAVAEQRGKGSEKSPPPQANRTRTRTHRCSAGNRSQACVGMGMGMGMGTAGANGCKAQDWDRICCTAPRQREWRCTAKHNQQAGPPAPAAAPAAPRSGSEDTELVHKRHKDAVLWPTISLGQVEDGFAVGWNTERWSKEGVNLLTTTVLDCKVGEPLFAQGKRQRQACKKSKQATMTGSRGWDEGARGRLGWERPPGRKGGRR